MTRPNPDTLLPIPADADAPVTVLHRGKWLTLKQRGRWEFVARTNPLGAVIIVAVTAEDCLLFVEQYRVPLREFTIEMPAGLVGDAGHQTDSVATAARRELEEETGYTCERIIALHTGPISAGMSTEVMHYVRACGLRKVGAGGGDDSENILVHEIPRTEAAKWLKVMGARGYSIDPKLFAGLWLLAESDC